MDWFPHKKIFLINLIAFFSIINLIADKEAPSLLGEGEDMRVGVGVRGETILLNSSFCNMPTYTKSKVTSFPQW